MKSAWGLLILVIVGVALNSCFDKPSYPTTPEIDYKSVYFKEVPDLPNQVNYDTLVIQIDFKDGDGDLGLNAQGDDGLIYSDHFYFKVNDKKKYVTTDPSVLLNMPDFIRYKTKRTNHNYDTLPSYVSPYTCLNWEIPTKTANGTPVTVTDTLYFQINPNHDNIFVDFLVKQNDGSFKEYDFRKEFCTTYDGRFPVLSKDLKKASPLEGTINYSMAGSGFLLVFSIKTLKLRVTIQDRALNKSNTIETPEFTLQSIKR